ncbi:uncharacterized protein LOC135384579 [Ornithodoros turicata]|uniref:uncharacterized protein LOC135384579 n=1 Tax=Ornithodoros turicata TaxID=34597 RepID=UPI003138A758
MDRLKHKRTARRTQITKLVNEVAELRGNNSVSKAALNGLLNRLVANDSDLRQINKDVEPLIKEEDLEEEYTTMITYEDQAHNAIAELQTRIAEIQLVDQVTATATPSPSARPSESERPHTGVKLPKLQLQSFAGELTQWQPFWEQYETTVHNNRNLTKTEKFQYLRSLLRGSAASAVMGLQASESCYDDAIEILRQRFGDRCRIEREHLAKLWNLPGVKSANDVHGLRTMYDHVQNNVRGLRALGVSSASYASMMVDILLTSLPSDMVVEYHRLARYGTALSEPSEDVEGNAAHDERHSTGSGSDSTASGELTKVLNFLRVEIESRERSRIKDTAHGQRASRTKVGGFVPTGAVLQNSVQVLSKRFFCNSADHGAPQCKCGLSLAEKRKRLSEDMRCYRCTRKGHRSKDCRAKITCSHCRKRHASSLCDPYKQSQGNSTEDGQIATTNMRTTNSTPARQDANILLQTFRAWATSDRTTAYLRGIIDGGSQRTFIREDVANKLQLKVMGETTLQLNTFANESPSRSATTVKIVKLVLHSQYCSEAFTIEALTIPFICKDLTATPTDHEFIQSIRRDKGFIADEVLCPNIPGEVGISLLVGCDQMWKLLTGGVHRCEQNEKLVAISTVFGWTFQGPTTLTCDFAKQNTTAVCVLRVEATQNQEPDLLKRFWELESIGIADEDKSSAEQNELGLGEFERNLNLKDGRYEVALPWKASTTDFPDNLEVAKSRLQGLVRRLQRNHSVMEYDEAIRSYVENDHAERVLGDSPDSSCTYYMPHRAVIRNGSTSTRIRVVFDASSHSAGATSLNDHLEKGPKLNSELVAILLRFRMHKIAITADIKKAFLQICIRPSDRDALRFLWFATPPLPGAPLPPIEIWRMTRVPFGTTASPFLLGATLQHHLKSTNGPDEDVANSLANAFYVDDLLTGADNVEEAKRLTERAEAILQKAGMKLDKWSSNSLELQKIFEQSNNISCNAERRLGETEDTKVLGVVWDKTHDHLRFSGEHILDTMIAAKSTKRSVLQTSAKIFDPLGILSPYTIRVEILFQRLWERGLEWDTLLPDDICDDWFAWCAELPTLHLISLERCLVPHGENGYTAELHIFTDASPQAYGACVFLRAVDGEGHVKVGLLFAKSRVAPIKKLTLPRLELMGAVMGVRIAKLVRDSLTATISEPTYWTDSTIALSWIKGNSSKWKPFVRNRVSEVQSSSDPSCWRHCPGVSNPADALTRGLTVTALAESRLWFHGPEWLSQAPQFWPQADTPPTEADLHTFQEEGVPKDVVVTHVTTTTPPLFDLKRYSTYQRILRVTAWIMRFTTNCQPKNRASGPLSSLEIEQAEKYWVKQAQYQAYQEEIIALSQGEKLRESSKIVRLQPFIDDLGVLRLTGRLQYADDTEEVKHPILLPKEHPLTRHIAEGAHRRTLHGGVQATLTDLRQRWWITQARQLVKSILLRCRVCARFRATRATAPTGPLPADRINRSHPFDTNGIDFAGPVYAKTGGAPQKSYIALFTCATTRAIHLELVSDLTSKSFIMAFRRFISRRGPPSTVYTDNALTFERAERDIKKLWDVIRSDDTQNFASTSRIHWKYIVERAAWWGGWWERMVRTVKQCLRRVLGRQCLTFEQMTTLLHEAEAAVNSRPLTFLPSTPDEPIALTPAHLLIGRTLTALLSGPVTTGPPSSAVSLRERWRHLQRLADHFWRRWKREYLLELRSAHTASCEGSPVGIQREDIALLHEERVPRHLWKVVRVTELYKGRDGKVRSCAVKLPSGHVTRRPVQLLFPLECA